MGTGAQQDYHNNPKKLLLYKIGESTPVSDLMGRENRIFTVVPKTVVQDDLDWRLPVFEAGPYLLAFDGAALLLLEMARKSRGETASATS